MELNLFQTGIYAVEMVDGRLYVYLDMGSGGTRAEVTSEKLKVNDGQWHEFSIWRNDRDIHCTVDDYPSDFTTNGKIRIIFIVYKHIFNAYYFKITRVKI